MVPFWGRDRSHCNTVPCGTPVMVQHARVNFWYFFGFAVKLSVRNFHALFLNWLRLQRSASTQHLSSAADEETPRGRGEAPTTAHSLLSEASRVEKRDFDEETAFYNSVVCGHFWGTICVKYHFCAFQIYLPALNVFAWNEAQIQRHSFRFLALNTMTGKRKREKTEQKNDKLPMFLNECHLRKWKHF